MVNGPEEEPPPLHALHGRSTAVGYWVWCRCGNWEGWWNGPRSQAAVMDDFDHHRRAAANGASVPPLQ